MKVKIGDKIYDSENEPIMIIMDDIDKENINKAAKIHTDGSYRFVTFPVEMNVIDIRNWMYSDLKNEKENNE